MTVRTQGFSSLRYVLRDNLGMVVERRESMRQIGLCIDNSISDSQSAFNPLKSGHELRFCLDVLVLQG